MSPATDETVVDMTGFPRVSGDEPLEDLTGETSVMFSPRERG